MQTDGIYVQPMIEELLSCVSVRGSVCLCVSSPSSVIVCVAQLSLVTMRSLGLLLVPSNGASETTTCCNAPGIPFHVADNTNTARKHPDRQTNRQTGKQTNRQ